jgi:hypothetical protein
MNTLARFQPSGNEPLPPVDVEQASAAAFPGSELRLKNTRPSETMLPSIGLSYQCPWIEDSITIHADGNVSCGLDDPHARRSFGNINEQTIAEIYANPEFDRVRDNLRDGRRCNGCNLFQPTQSPIEEPRAKKAVVSFHARGGDDRQMQPAL